MKLYDMLYCMYNRFKYRPELLFAINQNGIWHSRDVEPIIKQNRRNIVPGYECSLISSTSDEKGIVMVLDIAIDDHTRTEGMIIIPSLRQVA